VVTGDQSHRHPDDRLPPLIWEGVRVGNRIHYDRSDSRPNIPQRYPGRSIQELHNVHSGSVALLFNGQSLADYDLFKIKVPMIGMNRTHQGYETYQGPQPDYLCIVDTTWLTRKEVREFPKLINGSTDPRNIGYRTTASYRMAPFSFDLWRDGVIPTTTGHLALQVAAYMGFRDLYCLGLDLGGPHYDGTPSGMNMRRQGELCEKALDALKERGINVWSLGKSEAFPRGRFEDIC
jgi:hypothetical protein